jgi:hypothetical protein
VTAAGELASIPFAAISLATGGIATAGDCLGGRHDECAIGAIAAGLGIGSLAAEKAVDAARLGDDFAIGVGWVGDFTGTVAGAATTLITTYFGG